MSFLRSLTSPANGIRLRVDWGRRAGSLTSCQSLCMSDASCPTQERIPVDITSYLTLGLAAVRIGGGVQHHHLDRLARRGLIPHTRAGRLRLVAVSDLDEVRFACQRQGYLKAQVEDTTHVG